VLLRHSQVLTDMGWPVLLSASNKTFLGKLLDLDVKDRREASHSAHALGILGGCRILRAHDVRGARRVVEVLSAVLSA
jgi:dihydropteroate synthase